MRDHSFQTDCVARRKRFHLSPKWFHPGKEANRRRSRPPAAPVASAVRRLRGLTWGPLGNSARLSSVDEVPDLCEVISGLTPGPGEPRTKAAEVFAHVHVRGVDLMAWTAAELLLHTEGPPWHAHSAIRQARSLASIICSSEAAIDAYLKFAAEEAKAIIVQHRAAVLAVAEALIIHRTLNSTQIDNIIATAMAREIMRIEIERRKKWATISANAAEISRVMQRADG